MATLVSSTLYCLLLPIRPQLGLDIAVSASVAVRLELDTSSREHGGTYLSDLLVLFEFCV